MTPENIERIYRRSQADRYGNGPSGHPTGQGYPNYERDRISSDLALWWGLSMAVRLAARGHFNWSVQFFAWAFEMHSEDVEWDESLSDAELLMPIRQNACRIVQAEAYMQTWGAPSAFELWNRGEFDRPHWPKHIPTRLCLMSLSDEDFQFIYDVIQRGEDPYGAMFPPPRRKNSKMIKLTIAAQTIANYETKK